MENKTNLDKIKEFLGTKNKAHISEISLETEVLKNSVMGVLNKYTIQGKHFVRLGGGYYKLKTEEDTNGSAIETRSDDKESNEEKEQSDTNEVSETVSRLPESTE